MPFRSKSSLDSDNLIKSSWRVRQQFSIIKSNVLQNVIIEHNTTTLLILCRHLAQITHDKQQINSRQLSHFCFVTEGTALNDFQPFFVGNG
jgi:hypothetical protein